MLWASVRHPLVRYNLLQQQRVFENLEDGSRHDLDLWNLLKIQSVSEGNQLSLTVVVKSQFG